MLDFGEFESRHNDPAFHRFGEALLLPGLPQTIGSTLSEGSSQGPARSDHVHTLPTGYRSVYVSTTAPASPVDGDIWSETDTDIVWVYNGSTWQQMFKYGAMLTYTPTFPGGVTLGNGTVSGWYEVVGNKFTWAALLVFGTTTAITGAVTVATPLTMGGADWAYTCTARLFDATGSIYPGVVAANTTTSVAVGVENTAGTYGIYTNLSSTIPFTWAVSDKLFVSGWASL